MEEINFNKEQLTEICKQVQGFVKLQSEYWERKSTNWKWSYAAISTLAYFIIKQIAELKGNINQNFKIGIIILISIVLIFFTIYLGKLLLRIDTLRHLCDNINHSYSNYKNYLIELGSIPIEYLAGGILKVIDQIIATQNKLKKTSNVDTYVSSELANSAKTLKELTENLKDNLSYIELYELFSNQCLLPKIDEEGDLRNEIIHKTASISFLNYHYFKVTKWINRILILYLIIYISTLIYTLI